jgi:hypothetical protein
MEVCGFPTLAAKIRRGGRQRWGTRLNGEKGLWNNKKLSRSISHLRRFAKIANRRRWGTRPCLNGRMRSPEAAIPLACARFC